MIWYVAVTLGELPDVGDPLESMDTQLDILKGDRKTNGNPILNFVPGEPVGPLVLKGTVHFLFSVFENINFKQVWRVFLAGAPAGSWRAWVHCVNEAGCRNNAIWEALPGMMQVETVPSQRCTDLISPQWSLVNSAVGASTSEQDKFVFVSESCLPVKPFTYVYRTLLANDESHLCLMTPRRQWQMTRVNGVSFYLVKHSQWGILNRRDAQRFAEMWTRLDDQGRWQIVMPGRQFAGVRFLLDRKDRHNWRCADEFGLFATIFGLFVPGEFSPEKCPLNSTMRCRTKEELFGQARCPTMFFFYKTERNAVLKKLLKSENSNYTWRGAGHPMEIKRLSMRAISILRESDFLFARKFRANVQLPSDFTKVMYKEDPERMQGSISSSWER